MLLFVVVIKYFQLAYKNKPNVINYCAIQTMATIKNKKALLFQLVETDTLPHVRWPPCMSSARHVKLRELAGHAS
jgi:hypothetical protein